MPQHPTQHPMAMQWEWLWWNPSSALSFTWIVSFMMRSFCFRIGRGPCMRKAHLYSSAPHVAYLTGSGFPHVWQDRHALAMAQTAVFHGEIRQTSTASEVGM